MFVYWAVWLAVCMILKSLSPNGEIYEINGKKIDYNKRFLSISNAFLQLKHQMRDDATSIGITKL